MELKRARLKSVELGYFDFGQGKPLLVFHGFGATADQADMDVFKKYVRNRIIIPIYPGYPGSGRWRKKYNAENISAVVGELVTYLGLTKLDVMGHSFGTIVAKRFADRYPDVVERIVFVGTPSSNSELIRKIKKYRWIVKISRWRAGRKVVKFVIDKIAFRKDNKAKENVLRALGKFGKNIDNRALVDNVNEILRYNFDTYFENILKPVVFIYGEADELTPVCKFPGYRTLVVSGKHKPMIDNPEEFFRKMYEFLEGE